MQFKKGALSILLVLAMLTLAFAALLPITASADPGDPIQAFNVQPLNDLDLADDDTTTLRFVFKITNLDYEKVGIVISKTVATPTCGAEHCYTKEVTTVYHSINVSGTPEDAGENLWWVAIKLTNVPHEYFDGALYVRAFVKNADQDPTYSDASMTTVCEAAGHTHVASLLSPHCAGCDLDVDSPEVLVVNSTEATNYYLCASYQDEILAGGKHFYPTPGNPDGNDLYIEFSILWNEAFANNCKGTLQSGNCKSGGEGAVKWTWMTMNNGGDGRSDSPYAGGFELSDLGVIEYPVGVSMAGSGSAFDQFPNLAGPDQANPEYGWHRVTFKLHQELTNDYLLEADETAGATMAQYTLTGTYYIDGVKLVQVSYSGDGSPYWGKPDKSTTKNSMHKGLFSARSDGNGGIVYKDCFELTTSNKSTHAFVAFFGVQANDAEVPGYIVYGDLSFTCGTAPVQNVKRAEDPTVATIASVGYGLPTNVYYQFNVD